MESGREIELDSGPASGRRRSLEALRGFEVFWIAGGGAILAAWRGFTFWDLIVPSFLPVVGVALPL